jgi:hypothetical protein
MTQAILVPDELYERLNSAAASVRRPIEEVAARVLSAGLPPGTDDVPAPVRSSLRRLQEADDDTLWKVWHSRVPEEQASRHRDLLEKNAGGTLTSEERRELGRLRRSADRLMLERGHAAALLRWRGHAVPLAD